MTGSRFLFSTPSVECGKITCGGFLFHSILQKAVEKLLRIHHRHVDEFPLGRKDFSEFST